MISSKDFSRLIYRKPFFGDRRRPVDRIAALDSEAYTTGEPFLFCTSRGDAIDPPDLFNVLFSDKYIDTHFFLYNLTYDSGAILYGLPEVFLRELWDINRTQWDGYTIDSIPHKHLKISRGKHSIWFWDIRQFFDMSLDNAAKKYLGKKKIGITTKKFTPRYVRCFRKSIIRYCVQDARLTEELARYFIDKLGEFGITTNAFYSCASIAGKYFAEHSRIVDVWRFWKHYPELLQYATDSYEGGKFEVTAAGSGDFYEYDISSAYPYEIANLVDIRKARVKFSSRYQRKAVYGFLRVKIVNDRKHLPCGIMEKNARIYPQGSYCLTITKQEYDYCKKIRVGITILSGYWLFVKTRMYPYRREINYLFSIKSRYKGKDPMIYNIIKFIMNSFYGKMAQVNFDRRSRKYRAGMYWNPMYASIITANTRIRMADFQNRYKDDCIAVHTDSVMLTCAARDRDLKGRSNRSPLRSSLGSMEFVTSGRGTMIACGMYQIGEANAFKGFDPVKESKGRRNASLVHEKKIYYTWKELLEKYRGKASFSYPYLHVETWYEAMAKNHSKSAINVFHYKERKKINLNCDVKRKWSGKFTGGSLLKRALIRSEPLVRIEKE